jgi:uncharacterized protein (DUF1501 family)
MSSRRQFLRSSVVFSLTPTLPTFLCRLVAAETQPDNGRLLIVIQLDGGNDGINTVVPTKDEGYVQHRRALRLPEADLIKVADEFALHPRLRSISTLFEEGRLSIAHGVGYPNPNRSHFESMRIWQAGSTNPEIFNSGNGWIGDAFGATPVHPGETQAIHVGQESLPLALVGRRCNAAAIFDPAEIQLRPEVSQPSAGNLDSKENTLLDFVSRNVNQAYVSATQLRQAMIEDSSARYPDNRLGQKLQLVSQLMKTGTGASVYYTSQAGYDTHAGQVSTHADLLGELSSSLKAFMDDMKQSGLEDRVLVMCFSEFGRRVTENDSLGTDHGTAGPVLLAGTCLAERTYGELPLLTDLDDGDLRFNLDFRELYSAIVTNWLGLNIPEALRDYRMARLFRPTY